MAPADPIQLTRQLIDIPSVTGDEAAVGSFLDGHLQRLGFTTRRHEISPGRFNLLATTSARPRVVLCSHMDTVPPFFPSSDLGDSISGRGACDTKGIIAAMLAAGEELLAAGQNEFGFLLVVGEETDSIGAKKANIEFGDLGSEFVVVGEPTESTFVSASKGAFTCTVRFEGIAAHSAYPERGESAIRQMLNALRKIDHEDWGSHPLLGNATVNIGVVRGGRKANIVPDEAEADMMFRTVGSPDEIREGLERILRTHHGRITASYGNPPMFMVSPKGTKTMVVAFNTDVPHLGALGRPILFGPGSILDAHSATEKIRKDEIVQAVQTYRKLVVDLLRGDIEVHAQAQ